MTPLSDQKVKAWGQRNIEIFGFDGFKNYLGLVIYLKNISIRKLT